MHTRDAQPCAGAARTGLVRRPLATGGGARPLYLAGDSMYDTATRAVRLETGFTMNATPPSLLADLQARMAELLRNSPAADIERNMKALLAQAFQRADLVTREEFDAQLERLTRLQQRVEQLERLLAERSS